MRKGIEDLDARAMKKDTEKGCRENLDKGKDHVKRRKRDEGDTTWEH
jgi:hypothetical protein